MGKHTGKAFYSRKKIPYPIDLSKTGKDLEKTLNDCSKNTYFIFGNGPVYTLKIARLNQKQDFIVENILEGFYSLISNILCD